MEKGRVAIGNDRCATEYKRKLKMYLESKGYEVIDCGTNIDKPVDYPVYGERVGKKVTSGDCSFGIVLCGTGIGISIAANKVKGVRCGVAYSDEVTELMRKHNDVNVISFGVKFMDYAEVEKRLDIFLNTDFLGDYHEIRVEQMKDIEKNITLKTEFVEVDIY